MNEIIKSEELRLADYGTAAPLNSVVYPIAPKDNNNYYIASNPGYSAVGGSAVMKAMNNTVLCEPFKTNTVQKRERSGFATAQQKVTLTGIKVLVGTDAIPTGSTVFVRAEACQNGWGKEIFESEGLLPFIRVPESEIIYLQAFAPNYGWTLQSYSPTLDYNVTAAK